MQAELTFLGFGPYAWNIVKRFLYLALLFGALFGFFGQGVAMAMAPNCEMAVAQRDAAESAKHVPMVGTMDCCPEPKSENTASKYAKDAMPNCPMMVGCFVSLALANAPAVPAVVTIKGATGNWAPVTRLSSRATTPEPPPPTI